jgi:hypothetical protein
MDKFVGKWQVTSTENMANMLQAFDMEENKRKIYSEMKFQMEYLREDDNTWVYIVSMPDGTNIKTIKFKLGQDYDSTTFDGRPIVSHVEFTDGKFVESHSDVGDPTLSSHVTREIIGDELIVTATVRNVSSITRHRRM